HLCNKTIKIGKANWLLPAPNARWVCKTLGVTPCLSTKLFNNTYDYCVQVIIVPKIIYHPKDYVLDQQETAEHHLIKREPFTALTIAVLLTVGGVGAGTGIASLTSQSSQLKTLKMAVDEDILKLEKSIDALVKSVRSLSEVVLQNRRGLDILFMQQGGLCVALKEQCCTYVDYTGVAVDTMAELKKQIEQRKRDYESHQSWYETWFNRSPWFTTMLSTIMGPLILIVLGLTFGPCIFNRLIAIVKSRL
ncbi:ENV1 protein, partial [Ptilorrhoa leucosticta]|nr:ENV1 protein [Ptilorrhoa leucosticta]